MTSIRAFQIEVVGRLDGATAFVIPEDQPVSDDGVVRLQTAADVGTIDLSALYGPTQAPVVLTAYNALTAAANRATRTTLEYPGQLAPYRIRADPSGTPPTAPVWGLSPRMIVPAGALLTILTDDVDDTFGGSPVEGPHFVYIELAVVNPPDETAARAMETDAHALLDGQTETAQSFQAVAATLSSDVLLSGVNQAIVRSFDISIGAAPAAGESMVVELIVVDDGSGGTVTIATATIDNTWVANTTVSVTISAVDNYLRPGDRLRIDRTYVAGGGPTPLTNTLVSVSVGPAAFPQA